MALKDDGSLVIWGNMDYGGNASKILHYTKSDSFTDIVKIYPSTSYFVGVRSDGSYVTWGKYTNI